jgi:hypothetical protein
MTLPRFLFTTCWALCSSLAFAQESQTVQWRYKAEHVNQHEAVLTFTAFVAPGWHLYSQYLKEGGPQPTRFIFDESSGFALVGNPTEKGERVTYKDETYNMEITWYTGVVNFVQNIYLNRTAVNVSGRIEYMTCNARVCQPHRQGFMVSLPSP